jgi:ATP-dependent helicase/nuclease subunit B
MKQLIYGPWGPEYRDAMLEPCVRYLQEWDFDAFYYIVPTAGLAEDVRQRLLRRVPGWLGKPVLTFDDLIELVIRNASVRTQRIDMITQERILHHLMLQKDQKWAGKRIKDWAHYPGVVSALLRSISELRRAGAKPEHLAGQEDENTQALVSLWRDYEAWLRKSAFRILDVEEGFLLAEEILSARGVRGLFPHLKCLIFDHFLDFTPLQKRILQHLLEVEHVSIYIPLRQSDLSGYPEIAAAVKDLRGWLERATSGLPATMTETLQVTEVVGTEYKALSMERIKIHAVQSMEKQWLWAAKTIKQLVNEGVSLDSIALLVPDLKSHMPDIDRIFRLEGIPHRQAVTQPLNTVPIVQDVVTLLRIVAYDWEREDVLTLAKRLSLLQERVPVAALERLSRKLGIQRGREIWFARIAEYFEDPAKQTPPDPEARSVIQWLERLKQLTDLFPKRASLQTYVSQLQILLQALRWKEKLVQKGKPIVERFCSQSGYDLRRDTRAVEQVEEWLRNVQTIEQKLGKHDEDYEIEELLDLIETDWEQIDVATADARDFGVWILEPSAARGLTFKHVLFANLNEGKFPQTPGIEWLLTEEQRKELLKSGIPIVMKSMQLELQNAFFSMAFTLASETLHLLYVRDERQLRSRFLDALVREYPDLQKADPAENHLETHDPYLYGTRLVPVAVDTISNPLERDLWNAWQWFQTHSPDESRGPAMETDVESAWFATSPKWRYILHAAAVERERAGGTFGIYEGWLTDPRIHEDLQERFHFQRTYSASFFNQYGECPFKFFLSRVLDVELPEEEGDRLSPVGRGNLYHAVLFRLYAEWQQKQDKTLSLAERDSWLGELRRIFEEEVERFEQQTYVHANPTWSAEKAHIWEALQEWLDYELKRLTDTGANWKPYRLEWSFGMPLESLAPSDPHSIEEPVKVADLWFQGRIDRIDYSEEAGLFLIYDYKTTGQSQRGLKEVTAGIDFQLPIYLAVVQQLKERLAMSGSVNAAGALYYGIEKEPRLRGLLHETYKEPIGLKRQGHVSPEEWDAILQRSERLLRDYHQAMQHGQYPLQPRKCTDGCPYKTVCRYDELLALNKETGIVGEGGSESDG